MLTVYSAPTKNKRIATKAFRASNGSEAISSDGFVHTEAYEACLGAPEDECFNLRQEEANNANS